jgi:hypothetical protein
MPGLDALVDVEVNRSRLTLFWARLAAQLKKSITSTVDLFAKPLAWLWSLDIFKALSGPLWSAPAERGTAVPRGDGALTPLHPRPSG